MIGKFIKNHHCGGDHTGMLEVDIFENCLIYKTYCFISSQDIKIIKKTAIFKNGKVYEWANKWRYIETIDELKRNDVF